MVYWCTVLAYLPCPTVSWQGNTEMRSCAVLGIIFSCSATTMVVRGVGLNNIWKEEGITLSEVPWVQVTNRASLETGLTCTSCVLAMQVNNGTEYLHLGGDINTFLPIVTEHSQTAATSDLTLEQAMSLIKKKKMDANKISNFGLYVSFLTPDIVPSALSVMSSFFSSPSLPFPLLVSARVLDASRGKSSTPLLDGEEFLTSLAALVPGATPVLGWATYHGMDKVWARVSNDNILKDFQTSRVVRVVEALYDDPENIPKEDVRFVELLQKKLERSNPSSFTELVVGHLVKSIQTNGHHKFEKDPFAPRYASKRPRKELVRELLPEYYLSSSSYSKNSVSEMKELVKDKEGVGLMVRAGLVNGKENGENLLTLVNNISDSFVVVTIEAGDREDRTVVEEFINIMGRDRVIVSLKKEIKDKIESVDMRIPQPRSNPDTSDGYRTGQMGSVLVTLLVILQFMRSI